MSWLGKIASGVSDGLSNYGMPDANKVANNVVQPALDDCLHMFGRGFSFDQYVEHGFQRGYTPETLADLRYADVHGMEFTESGIKRLSDELSGASSQPLLVAGANLDGCSFNPYTTAQYLDHTTEALSGHAASMQQVAFVGISDTRVEMSLPEGMNISGFSFANDAGGPGRNIAISGESLTAASGNIAGTRYAKISVENSDLTGLQASGAIAPLIEARGSRLDGMEANGVHFAPGCKMEGCSMIGLQLTNGNLFDASLRNSRVSGSLAGTEIGGVDWNGAIVDAPTLQGALVNGEPLNTSEQINQFMQANGITLETRDMTLANAQVGNNVRGMQHEVASTDSAVPAVSGDMGAVASRSMDETDGLLAALMAANNELGSCGVTRTEQDCVHDNDLTDGIVSHAQNNEINHERVDHGAEYTGRATV